MDELQKMDVRTTLDEGKIDQGIETGRPYKDEELEAVNRLAKEGQRLLDALMGWINWLDEESE